MGWKHGNIRMLNLGLWKVKAKYLYEWTRLTRSCGRLQKRLFRFHHFIVYLHFILLNHSIFHVGKQYLTDLTPCFHSHRGTIRTTWIFRKASPTATCYFFWCAWGNLVFHLRPDLAPWNMEFGTFEKTRWKQPITHILEQKDAIFFYTSLAALRLTMPSQPIAPVAPSMQWWLAARFQVMFGCNWSQLSATKSWLVAA